MHYHVVYSPLWAYVVVILIYFSINIQREQYIGSDIMKLPIGVCLQHNSHGYYSIFAASVVSIAFGTVTLIDLQIYPSTPAQSVLNRSLLTSVLFIPVGYLIAMGISTTLQIESAFPFAVLNVHIVQSVFATAAVIDFFRKVCPTAFTDIVCGSFCALTFASCVCLQIGFGYDIKSSPLIMISVILACLSTVPTCVAVWRFLNDEAAMSFWRYQSWELSVLKSFSDCFGLCLQSQ